MDSTIVQPMTIRGAVEKPNSSAPKIAATTTSNLKDDRIYFSYSTKDENQYTEKNCYSP